MFEAQTVFVIGAGASAEVGLPIGRKLTQNIAALLNLHLEVGRVKSGDGQIYETIRGMVHANREDWENNTLIGSAQHISEAMTLAPSIDTFVETYAHNREIVLLSKLGIAKAILQAEQKSKLATTNEHIEPFRLSDVAESWYPRLAEVLFTGVSANNPEDAFTNVTFVVFNYDRCLEVFLARALQVYFRMSVQEAQAILKNVRILHPYGSLGSVFDADPQRVSYGRLNVQLAHVASGLDTYSETIRDKVTLDAIRSAVKEAQNLVFLGFAFHRQNMDLLTAPEDNDPVPHKPRARVLATTYNVSEPDTKVVRSLLSRWAAPETHRREQLIYTYDGECWKFFDRYRLTLMSPFNG